MTHSPIIAAATAAGGIIGRQYLADQLTTDRLRFLPQALVVPLYNTASLALAAGTAAVAWLAPLPGSVRTGLYIAAILGIAQSGAASFFPTRPR